MTRPEFYLIYNPKSGGSNSALNREKVFAELNANGVSFNIHDTDDTDTFGKTTTAIAEGHRKFIIVGGDGTLNQAVNAIFKQTAVPGTEITLCLIPFGTGNDWIRTVGIPADYREAAKLPKHGKPFIQDVGRVVYQGTNGPETHYFANIAGFGYDAYVNRNTNESAAKSNIGKFSYLYTLFKCLLSYKHTHAKITVDDTTVKPCCTPATWANATTTATASSAGTARQTRRRSVGRYAHQGHQQTGHYAGNAQPVQRQLREKQTRANPERQRCTWNPRRPLNWNATANRWA